MKKVTLTELLEKNPHIDAGELEKLSRRFEESRAAGYNRPAPYRITRTRRAVIDETAILRSRLIVLNTRKTSRK